MAFDPSSHLRSLKGQQYLDVKWRLMWLNDEAESKGLRFSLTTELLHYAEDRQEYTFKAMLEIYNQNGEMLKRTTGTGTETYKDFPSGPAEKAETKAIGRALGHAGLGTQFALEFEPAGNEDGERIVDSPVTPAKPAARAATSQEKQDDGTALLRSQLVAALKADPEAAARASKKPDDMSAHELQIALDFLRKRAEARRQQG